MEVKSIGYTVLATEYESQIIVIATPGQSGHIALRVLKTGIDGGGSWWPEDNNGVHQICYYPYGKLRCEDACDVLRKTLQEEPFVRPDDVDLIVSEFKKNFQL